MPRKTARLRSKLLDLAEDSNAVNGLFATLVGIANNPMTKASDRINAARCALEFTLGKPEVGVDLLVDIEAIADKLVSANTSSSTSDFASLVRNGLN